MKKIICLILAVAALSTYSCTIGHHDCCDVAQRWAEITALKNGIAWSPLYVNGVLTDLDSLKIAAMSGTATAPFNKIDTLNIKVSYIGTGTYQLNNNRVFYATFANGAATQFKLDTTYNNVLNITSYQRFDNPATTVPNDVEVKGTFDIRFIDPNNASGISITNASFYAIMQR